MAENRDDRQTCATDGRTEQQQFLEVKDSQPEGMDAETRQQLRAMYVDSIVRILEGATLALRQNAHELYRMVGEALIRHQANMRPEDVPNYVSNFP